VRFAALLVRAPHGIHSRAPARAQLLRGRENGKKDGSAGS